MDNILSKGIFLTVASTLVAAGVVKIGTDVWIGVGLMLLGGGVYVLREILKKKGYDISGKR